MKTDYFGLVFTEEGQLFGTHGNADTDIYSVNKSNGTHAFSAATRPTRTFWDMGGHEVSAPWGKSDSLWAIVEDSTAPAAVNSLKARLIEFKNYRTPLIVKQDWGQISLPAGLSLSPFAGSSEIASLAITGAGTGYFVRNGPTVIDGVTYHHPLFKIEVGSQAVGQSALASFVGDLTGALTSLGAGSGDSVTGLAAGTAGDLFGVVQIGDGTVPDRLFTIANLLRDSNGQLINIFSPGLIQGAGAAATLSGDLSFSSNGILYVTDNADNDVYRVDSTTAAIVERFSTEIAGAYSGFSVNPADNDLTASDTSANKIVRVLGGSGNDTAYFDYAARFGLSNIRAIAFFNGAFVPTESAPPYFAVDRTQRIYAVDPATGTTTLVTATAPFPLDALAYDRNGGFLYYVENTDANFRLGRYTLSTNSHSILGNLASGANTYNPSGHPQHLIFYSGDLYYLNGNSDDLVRVRVSSEAIIDQEKVSDVNRDNSLGIVQSAALNDAGILYFTNENVLMKYNMRTLSGYTAIAPGFGSYESLLWNSSGGTLHGAASAAVTRIDTIGTATGHVSGGPLTAPPVLLYDMSGPNSAVPSSAFDTIIFAVTGGNKSIYAVNPVTGQNSLLDSSAPFNVSAIALDGDNALLYYLEDTADQNTWRLGRLSVNAGVHVAIGNIKSNSLAYRPAERPRNLAFFNGDLYYIPGNSDDLVKVSIVGSTILQQVKVADLRKNTAFVNVGDLAVTPGGILFFTDNIGSRPVFRYDLATLSGLHQFGTASRYFEALAWYGSKLYAAGGSTSLDALNYHVGLATLGSVNTAPARAFVDFASAVSGSVNGRSSSVWAIAERGLTGNLVDFRNYRSAQLVDSLDYGEIFYMDGSTQVSLTASGPKIRAMVVTNTGRLFFVNDERVTLASQVFKRALFYIDLGGIELGRPVLATFVGDLEQGLPGIGSNDRVTSLGIGPDGALYGSYRTDSTTAEDFLFRMTSLRVNGSKALTDVAVINRFSGEGHSVTVVEDLAFGPDGTLYVSDAFSSEIMTVNPSNAVINGLFSSQRGVSYLALSMDPADNTMIGSYVSGTGQSGEKVIQLVTPGAALDQKLFDYGNKFNYGNIESMSFYTRPFVAGEGALYAIGSGEKKIYTVNAATGSTGLIDADSPTPSGAIQTLAYSPVTHTLYYSDAPDAGGHFRLYAYSLVNDSHTLLGQLDTGLYAYSITQRPSNLTAINGDLFFVHKDTDDLVRIRFSGSAITAIDKMADLSGDLLVLGDVGDLTVRDDGMLYLATNALLYRYNLETLSGFQQVAPAPASWKAISFSNGNLVGNRTSIPTFLYLINPNDATDVLASATSPALDIADFASAEPGVNLPTAPASPYFGVNGAKTIFTVNPETAATTVFTTGALFDAGALAYDKANAVLYYVEKSDVDFRLGRFDITSGQHTNLGSMEVATFNYTPAHHPHHLAFYNDDLYYINKDSDDLVRVSISGATILSQDKVADLNSDLSLNVVGAATVNDAGLLYFSNATSLFKYDLRGGGGALVVNSSFPGYSGLMWNSAGAKFAGTASITPSQIDEIGITGTVSSGPLTVPSVSFIDLAGGNAATAPPPSRFYGVNRTTGIYQVDPLTGTTAQLPTLAAYDLDSIAYDAQGKKLYVVESTNTDTRLGRYDIATNTFTSLGNLRAPTWSFVPTERPQHLFFYDGSLYYINYDASTTAKRDDLVKVKVSDAAIVSQMKIADVAADSGLSRVTAAAVDDSGWLYFNAGSTLKKFDLRNLSGLATVNPSTAIYSGLLWYEADNFLYGANSNSNKTRNELTRLSVVNGGATFQASTNPSVPSGFYDLAGGNNAQPPPSLDVPKAYIGGDFSDASGNFHNLARLNNDGTLDTAFNTGIGADGPVRAICRLSTGQILVGGEFGTYQGVTRPGLARVNSDGSIDSSFNPTIFSSGITTEVALDWANWTSFVQNMALSGADPWFGTRNAYYGLASATGGVAGFGSQTWNNVSGSGVNMTLYVSQNMTESNDQLQGPDLHGDIPAYTGGVNPDRRVPGHTALRFTSDQHGSTIAPATIVASFSEPVYINQAIWGSLSSLGGSNSPTAENLVRNGSFETGPGWNNGPNWFPNSTHPNKRAARADIVNAGVIDNWGSENMTWVEDGTRAAEGNFFVYLHPSAQGSNHRVTQNLIVGDLPGAGINLVSGRSYRVTFNCAAFHPYLASGHPDYTVMPQFEFQYQNPGNQTVIGQMPLIDSATSVTVSPSAAQNWDDLQWRTVTGTFTAPAVSSSSANLGLWVSLIKGSTNSITSGTNYMSNYNVICFEDLSSTADVDGKTWVGGNITSPAWFQMGDLYTAAPNDNVVVVCGTVGGASSGPGINFAGGSNAKLVVKDSSSRGARPINWLGGGSQSTRLKIESSIVATNAVMRADLEQRALAYRELASNSSVITPAGQPDARIFRCSPQTVNGQAGIAVFNVDATDLFGNGSLAQVDIDSSSGNSNDVKGVVINVSGANVNWTSNFSFGGNFTTNPWRQKVLWNFHQATTFAAGSHPMNGAVLASYAAVTSSSNFDGSLVCKSLTTTGECHRVVFLPNEAINMVGTPGGLLIDNVQVTEAPTYVGSRFENAYFRAFRTPDATGAPLPATSYANISDRTTPLLGTAADPVTTVDFNNVRMDYDTSDAVYHTIGAGAEEDGRYGRISISYTSQPVRSLAFSFWTTATTEPVGAMNLPSFNAPLTAGDSASTFTLFGFTRATPPLGKIYAILEQPDGKILIGGDFGQINGASSKNVARLNSNGSLDTTFNPGSGPNGPIYAMALRSDGSLVVGGSFSTWNGQPSGNRLVLLSSVGARDTAFNAGISNGPGDLVNWLDLESSGKIIVGGKFSAPRNGIARLNSNGTNDTAFDPGSGVGTSAVNDGVLLPGGGLLLGGDFTTVNGTTRNRIAKLTAGGAVDTAWTPGTGFDNVVQSVALLSGSAFAHAAGSFTHFQGNPRNNAGVIKLSDASPGVTPWGPSALTFNRVWTIQ
ncbi:MAG: choice-of-anchor A family protein [Verrucomicrobiales bacterium]